MHFIIREMVCILIGWSLIIFRLPAKMQKSGLRHFISTPVFPSMVDSRKEYIPQDKAEKFTSKFWGENVRGTPQIVKVMENEAPISLYPALKVQAGCKDLHITHAISMVSICKG